MKFISPNPDGTEAIGRTLALRAKPGEIIALYGGMGAGKTTLTRGILAGFGYTGSVTSPTFSIVNEYDTPKGRVCHFDMYRITSEEALLDIGWEDYLKRGDILIVEWCENIAQALPEHFTKVTLEFGPHETARSIDIEKV